MVININYAMKNGAIILFDSAYECFIGDKNLPRSIYEIENSKKTFAFSLYGGLIAALIYSLILIIFHVYV